MTWINFFWCSLFVEHLFFFHIRVFGVWNILRTVMMIFVDSEKRVRNFNTNMNFCTFIVIILWNTLNPFRTNAIIFGSTKSNTFTPHQLPPTRTQFSLSYQVKYEWTVTKKFNNCTKKYIKVNYIYVFCLLGHKMGRRRWIEGENNIFDFLYFSPHKTDS